MMNNKKNMQKANNEGFAVLAQQDVLSEVMAEDCQGLEFSFDRVKLPAAARPLRFPPLKAKRAKW